MTANFLESASKPPPPNGSAGPGAAERPRGNGDRPRRWSRESDAGIPRFAGIPPAGQSSSRRLKRRIVDPARSPWRAIPPLDARQTRILDRPRSRAPGFPGFGRRASPFIWPSGGPIECASTHASACGPRPYVSTRQSRHGVHRTPVITGIPRSPGGVRTAARAAYPGGHGNAGPYFDDGERGFRAEEPRSTFIRPSMNSISKAARPSASDFEVTTLDPDHATA